MSWYIYGLRLNVPNSPYRYVGLTTKPLADRLRLHINDSRRKTTPVCRWISSNGFGVLIEPIEECPEGDVEHLLQREIYWIAYYRETQGSLKDKRTPDYLKNVEDGRAQGAYGQKLSEEHISRIKSGVRKHFRENGHKSVYEFWVDSHGQEEADRRWGSLIQQRRDQMSGTGNNMYGRTGPNAPAYGRIGAKHPMFGIHHSEDARRRISEATKGKPKSPATKVRMSLANHNRYHQEKIKDTCKWCHGAILQEEIDKELSIHDQTNDVGRRVCPDPSTG